MSAFSEEVVDATANAIAAIEIADNGSVESSPQDQPLVLSEAREQTISKHQRHMEILAGQSRWSKEGRSLLIGDSLVEFMFRGGAERLPQLIRQGLFLAGVSGDTIQNVCWRVEQGLLRAAQPERIIMMIGTNNLATTRISDFTPLYQNLLQTIKVNSEISFAVTISNM